MKRIFGLLLIFVLAFALVACTGDQTPPEDDNGDDIVDETPVDEEEDKPFAGTVLELSVAYGGADASFEKFTEETGIEIEWVEMSTGAKLSQLQAEEGNTTSDIWFGGGVDSYIAARDLGYLHQYKSPETENIDDKYLDPEGYFAALAVVPYGFIVNTELLEELELDMPDTWDDLLDPKLNGEIIMADPNISGGQYAILSGLIQAMGEEEAWEYWEKINDMVDYYAQSGGEPAPKVSQGEFAVGLNALTGGTFGYSETSPLVAVFPKDFIPWTPAPIAIFESSENKEAAKVLVDWYLSEHGQNILKEADARVMANRNVALPEQMKDLDMDALIDFDLEKMGSERENILNRWNELVGQ